jgi:response regulator of citrate/malate metabolism
MPPADEKPVPGSQSRPSNPAKSDLECQGSPARNSDRQVGTALIFAPESDLITNLHTGLTKMMTCVIRAESLEEACRFIGTLKSDVKIIIVAVSRNHAEALRSIRLLRGEAARHRIPHPDILAIATVTQTPDVPLTFERLGVHYLLRPTHEQLIENIRKIQWNNRTKKQLPTLIIQRQEGHVHSVAIQTGVSERKLRLGPRLRQLVEHLALYLRTEHTTEMIADAIGICRPTVKAYLFRVRNAFNEAVTDLQLGVRGEDVFWTNNVHGGYVHGMAANVQFRDE